MPLRTAKLKGKKQLTKDVIELTFQGDEEFDYIAGQFITIKINDAVPPCFRAYSINSAPRADRKTFELCLKIIEGGRATNWLNQLKVDDTIEFLGPTGRFIFNTPPEKTAIFIATGTGITPLKAMVEGELAKKTNQKLHLIMGLRYVEGIFYKEYFEELAAKNSNFTFTLSLTRPDETWTGQKGRVTDILKSLDLEPTKTESYSCGLKVMIDDVEKLLLEKGLDQESIHSEKYD